MMNKCGMVSVMLFLFAGTFVTSVNAQTTPVSIDIGAHQVDLGTAGSTYTFDVFVDSVNEHVNGFEFQLEIAGQLAGPKFLASNTASFRSTSSPLTVNIANPSPDEDAVNRPTIGIPQSASGDRYIDYAVGVYDGDNVVINGHQFLGTVTLDLSGLDATVDKYRYGLTLGSGSGFAVNTDVNQEFPASSDPDFEAIHGSIAFVSNPIVVWSGGGADNSLLNFSNWLYQAAPLAGDALQFEGSTRTSVTFDQNADTSYFGITFNAGADSFTLSGTGIGLLNGGGITNKSANAQTVGLDITLADAATPTVTNTFDAQAGNQNFTGNITIGANGILVFTDSAGGDNTNTVSGIIAGATGTVRNTAGELILSGANTFNALDVTGGTVELANGNAMGTSSTVDVASGATLRVNAGAGANYIETVGQIDAVTGSVIYLSNSVLVLGSNNVTNTLAGNIRDTADGTGAPDPDSISNDPAGEYDLGEAGGLVVNGDGSTTTISGDNTYHLATIIGNSSTAVGNLLGTTVTDPTVIVGHNNAFGNSFVHFNNGTLQATDGTRTLGNDMLIGGNVTFGGTDAIVLGGNIELDGTAGDDLIGVDLDSASRTLTVDNTTTIMGTLDGTKDIIKAGNGRLVLSGNNDNASSNFTVNAGVLEVNNGSAIGDTKAVALTGAGTSLVVTGSETIGALTGSSTSTVDIATGQTLTTGADSDVFNTFSGKLAGTGIFKVAADATDDHSGVVELAGNSNAFAGDIDVTSGVLLVSGIVGPSSGSAVDVNVGTAGILAGGVLAGDSTGNGVINGNVTIGQSGGNGGMPNGELALATSTADSIDKLAINGNLTINAEGLLTLDVQRSNAGLSNDTLAVSGTFNVFNNAIIDVNDMSTNDDPSNTIAADDAFDIITYGGLGGNTTVTDVDSAHVLSGLRIQDTLSKLAFKLTASNTSGAGTLTLTAITVQNVTWDGGQGDGNWSSANNWLDDTNIFIVDGADYNLEGKGIIFTGNVNAANNIVIADTATNYTNVGSISFDGTSESFTLTGSKLQFINDQTADISNTSTSNQVIVNDIDTGSLVNVNAVDATLTINTGDANANHNDLSFGGKITNNDNIIVTGASDTFITDITVDSVNHEGYITGTGSLSKTGAGTLTLDNANDYAGNTVVNGGALVFGVNGSITSDVTLTSGTLNLNSASSVNAANSLALNGGTLYLSNAMTLANDLTIGGDVIIDGQNLTITDANGVTLSGAARKLTISNATTTVNTSVTGTGLTKDGTGILELAAANNLGALTIDNGQVLLSVADGLNGDTAVVINGTDADGALKLGAATTIGSLNGAGTLNLQSATLTIDGENTSVFSGTISGTSSAGLIFDGSTAGQLTLSNTNPFAGLTTVDGGTLTLDATGSLAGDMKVDSGGTLALGNDSAIGGELTINNGTLTTTTSNGDRSLANNLTIESGINVTGSNDILFNNNNTGTATLTQTTTTFNVGSGVELGIDRNLTGAGTSITKLGSGSLMLSGDNAILTGTVVHQGGTLSLGSDTALGSAQLDVADDASRIESTNDSIAIGNNLNLVSNVITFTGEDLLLTGDVLSFGLDKTFSIDSGTTVTFNGTFGTVTPGDLNKSGDGSMVLAGSNNFNSKITVDDGNLTLGNNSAIDKTDWLIINNDGGTNVGQVTVADGITPTITGLRNTTTDGGNLILNTGSSLTIGDSTINDTNAYTFAGDISGAGKLVINIRSDDESASQTLSGDNSGLTGGVDLNNGTLILGNDTALGNSASSVLTVNGGTLQSASDTIIAANNVSLTQDLTVAGSNNLTLSGIISDATTGHGVVKQGSGTLTLAGANTYAANTDVQAGGLALSNGQAINNDASITLYDGTNLLLNNSETIGTLISDAGDTSSTVTLGANTLTLNNLGDATYKGVISGSGGLALQGAASSFTLTGVNDYTGSTLVTGTELVLDNTAGNALATSDITLGALGTLSILSDESIKSLASSAADSQVDLGSSTLTITGLTSDQVFAGIIHNDSDGSLTYSSDNKLTLSNTNTYTGLTTVEQGTLEITGKLSNSQQINVTGGTLDASNDGGDALADTATVNVTGGTFDVTDNEAITKVVVEAAGTLNLDGTLTLERDATDMSTDFVESTISGTVTGTGDLTVSNYAHLNLESTTSTDVTVGPKGLLNLRGSAGDVVIENGGEFATYGTGMNHILDTAQVNNFTLNDGANFLVDIDVSTLTGDQITVANDFVLIDGAVFNISDINSNQPSALGDAFTLATIGGSLLDAATDGQVRTGDITSSVQLTEDFVDYSFTLNVSQDGGNTILTLTAAAVSEYVWDGGGDATNWSDNTNWKDDETVGFDVLGKSLTFQDATADTSVIADGGAYSNINSIKFNTSNADSSFTLSGNMLTLNTNANIVNNDNNHNTHIVNNDIKLGGQLYVAANQGDLQLGGIIDTTESGHNATFQGEQNTDVTGTIVGDGSVTKKGNGKVILSTANTYAGGTTLQVGTIVLGSSSVLDMGAIVSGPVGTGTLTIQGGTLEADDTNLGMGEVITVANELLISGDFTTSGDNLNLSGNGSLDGSDRQINVTNAITEFSGNLSNGSITKTGSGELLFTGSSDLGSLTINEGSVVLDGGNTVLDNGVVVHLNESATDNDSVLDLASDATIGSLSSDAGESVTVDLNANTLTIAGSNLLADATYNGVITNNGGGNLLFTGGFTQTLTGDNTYTGTTTVNATGTLEIAGSVASHVTLTSGTLLLADAAMSDSNKILTINGGNIGATNGAATIDNTVTVGSTVTVVGTDALNLTGAINLGGADRTFDIQDATQTTTLGTSGVDQTDTSATSGITKSGDGTLALAGNFKYTGDTTVNQGELAITTGSVAGNVILTDGKLTLGNDTAIDATKSLTLDGGTLNLDGASTISNAVTLGGDVIVDGDDVTLQTGGLAIGSDASTHNLTISNTTTTITSTITGSNNLSKDGAGTLVLDGDNTATYSGTTTLNEGTLKLTHAGGLGSGDMAVDGGLNTVTLETALTGTVANNINLGSDLTLHNASAVTSTLSGVIDDAANSYTVTKTGNDTVILTGANTFAALAINAGTIELDKVAGDALASDTAVTLTGTDSTLKLTNSQAIGTLDGSVGTKVQLQDSTLTVDVATSDSANFAGELVSATDAGGLTKTGNGAFTLSGDNSGLSGLLTVSGGTLNLVGANAINNDVQVNMNDAGAILTLDADQTVESLYGTAGTVAIGTHNLFIGDAADVATTPLTYAGTFTGTGELTKQSKNVLSLTGQNSGFAGATQVIDGTLILDAAGDTSALANSDLTVASPGILQIASDETIASLQGDGTTQIAGNTLGIGGSIDTTYAGVLEGTGGVDYNGTGTWQLTGTNDNFTGILTVNSGIVNLNSGGQTLAGQVVVAGGELYGIGSTGGDMTVSDGGTWHVGNNNSNTYGLFEVGGDLNLEANSDSAFRIVYAPLSGDGVQTDYQTAHTLNDAALAHNDYVVVVGAVNVYVDANISYTISDIDNQAQEKDAFDLIIVNTLSTLNQTDGMTETPIADTDNLLGLFTLTNPDLVESHLEVYTNDTGDTVIQLVIDSLVDFVELSQGSASQNVQIGAALESIRQFAKNNPDSPAGLKAKEFYNKLLALKEDGIKKFIDEVNSGTQGSTFAGQTVIQLVQTFNHVLANHLAARRSNLPIFAQQDASSQTSMLAGLTDDPHTLAQVAANEQDSQSAKDQMRLATPMNEWAAFAKIYGVFSNQDTTSSRTGYSSSGVGVQFGMDYQVNENLIVGLAFDYAKTSIDQDGNLGDVDVESFRIGPFASWYNDAWFVDANLTFGLHTNDSTRRDSLGTYEASYDSNDVSMYLGGGYQFKLNDSWTLTPTASLRYTYYNRDAYSESNGGADYASYSINRLYTRFGAKLDYRLKTMDMLFIPEVVLGWEHEYLNENDPVSASYLGTQTFSVSTNSPDSDSIFFGVGLTAVIDERWSTFVRYEGNVSENGDTHAITGGVRFDF
jgi:autotransporter-associated beta strand protein